jgi:cytochrome P450
MRLCLKVIGLALLSTDFGSSVETMLDAVLHFSRYAGTSVTERKGADVDAQTRDYEDAFLACLATVVEERRRASGGHDDALAMLLAHEPAEERDRALGPYLRDHLTTLIVTGSENPKNALSWAIHLLMKHPDVFAKVRDEVRSVVRGDVVSFDDLPRLRYTAQVFKEVLRLYPPAYAFGRRAVRDVQLGDVLIPAGAEVLVSPYALHRRADSFPNPERFDPERFSEKEEAKRPRGAYLPFGVGPRACIGGQLATLTGHTVLATLALRVSLERVSQDDVQPEPRATLRPATPIFAIASRVTS